MNSAASTAASALAKLRWKGKSKAERRAHMKMMSSFVKNPGRPKKVVTAEVAESKQPKRPVGRPRKDA